MSRSAPCPVCGGPGVALGSLGLVRHFRCRDCGATFGRKARSFSPRPKVRPVPSRVLETCTKVNGTFVPNF